MEKVLPVALFALGVAYPFMAGPDGALAVMVAIAFGLPSIALLRRSTDEKKLITQIFMIGLLLRLGLGLAIHYFDLTLVFGPDAMAYDYNGIRLMRSWEGQSIEVFNELALSTGYGMVYIVGAFYYVFGPSILIVQAFCGTIGALTAPIVYFCAHSIFDNKRVAKYAAFGVAVFPSFVIWSSQLLKDGLIIFLLVVIMTMLLRLQKKLEYSAVVILLLSLAGIMTLRSYIFYMVAVAVAGSIFIGLSGDVRSMVRNFIIVMILGVGLGYFGIGNRATADIVAFADLEHIQMRREALSRGADSGFVGDTDITTTAGAITAIPMGFAYLAFAPFPWQVTKLSQALVVPETIVWWCLIPLMISGIAWTLRNRLRKAVPILLFSLMLTAGYTLFQGNVGMVYRQRTQIQVFVFMFIATGITLILEKRENSKTLASARKVEGWRRRQMKSTV